MDLCNEPSDVTPSNFSTQDVLGEPLMGRSQPVKQEPKRTPEQELQSLAERTLEEIRQQRLGHESSFEFELEDAAIGTCPAASFHSYFTNRVLIRIGWRLRIPKWNNMVLDLTAYFAAGSGNFCYLKYQVHHSPDVRDYSGVELSGTTTYAPYFLLLVQSALDHLQNLTTVAQEVCQSEVPCARQEPAWVEAQDNEILQQCQELSTFRSRLRRWLRRYLAKFGW